MKVCNFSVAVVVVAALLCVADAAWALQSEDFWIAFDPGFAGGGGSGFEDGTWFYYPNTDWWNQWFYDDPFDETRWKVITGWVYVTPLSGENWVTITLNWSSPAWSPNPDMPPIPPLTPEEEADWVVRPQQPLFDGWVEVPLEIPIYEEILEYNPEWVSIDVMGFNVIVEGEIRHVCIGERHGINFTVEEGALGLGGSAVNNLVPDNEDDIFIGSGGTNLRRLNGQDMSLLGLVPGDDIDAISYGDPSVVVNLDNYIEGTWWESDGLVWHFSVDKFSQGAFPPPGNHVNNEWTTGTFWGFSPWNPFPNPPEALGDYFYTSFQVAPGNVYAGDEEQLGLDLGPGPPGSRDILFDELNGLDLLAAPINEPSEFFQPGQLYFSLKAGSPSLMTYGVHQADILTPDGTGGIKVAGITDGLAAPGDHLSLGITPDNDLDALFVDLAGVPFFSVEKLIPAAVDFAANPADVLVPDGFKCAGDGVADELIAGWTFGLRESEWSSEVDDNLDALDVEDQQIEPGEQPPQPGGGDTHADVLDTDGDGLPDSSEDGGGVYVSPTETGSSLNNTDSDADGFSDMLEVHQGTDPNVAGSNSPFTPLWVDFGSTETIELGTQTYPTKTLLDALRQVSVGGTLKITDDSGPNSTTETPRITKAMRIEAVAGPIAIGK